jgi:hypothetical protein
MINFISGVVVINGEVYGCIVEQREDCGDFAHLFNGECYNACEVDQLITFPDVAHIYASDIEDKLKRAYEKSESKIR